MYDMRALKLRYFEVILPDGKKLEVEPPKLKVLKSITALAGEGTEDVGEQALDSLIAALSKALSKNKQKIHISQERIIEIMNVDQMLDLMVAYFEWTSEIQSSKN